MKLLTHNLLQCHVRGCTQNNFPLAFKDAEVELAEVDFNRDFVAKLLGKIDYAALGTTVNALKLPVTLPAEDPTLNPQNQTDDALRQLHHVLLEVKVKNGNMVCRNCGHIYVVRDFIPNMLLQDDEV